MRKKIIGIVVCAMMITIISPMASSTTESIEDDQQSNPIFNEIFMDDRCILSNKIITQFNLMSQPRDLQNASPRPTVINELPEFFSWKDVEGQDWTTPAQDQGNCGSCWDYAAIGALESIINIREGHPDLNPDLSEQYVLSCLPRAGSCDGGLAKNAYKYINATTEWGNNCNGVVLESCFPYQANDAISCDDKCPDWEDALIPIVEYGYWYPDGSSEDIEAIKSQIMDHGPVVTTMMFTYYVHGENNLEEWGWTHHDPEDYYPYPGPSRRANHQVVLIGWKDDASIGNGGYWIVKNSCSPEWGYNGFFNIEYGSLNIDSIEIDWVEYDPESYNRWAPSVNAGGIYYATVGEEIKFDGSKTVDPEDDIELFSWDLGDGTEKTGIAPTHTYTQKGIYPVLLMVNDSLGKVGFDKTWAFIDETNHPPDTPVLRGQRIGVRDNTYEYTFYATDPDGDEVYFYLNWGDVYWEGWWDGWIGPYKSGEKVRLNNTWDTDGNYMVRVKAKDKYGFKSDWEQLPVYVSDSKSYFGKPFPYFMGIINVLLENLLS